MPSEQLVPGLCNPTVIKKKIDTKTNNNTKDSDNRVSDITDMETGSTGTQHSLSLYVEQSETDFLITQFIQSISDNFYNMKETVPGL